VNRAHLKRIWLFIIAIALHNFPEGLAVGVGFATGQVSDGLALALGIGLQNIPEGLVVALSLAGQGYSRLFAFAIALLTGLVEPISGILGATVVCSWLSRCCPGAWLLLPARCCLLSRVRSSLSRTGRGWSGRAPLAFSVGFC
jgi:zinc transporter ZupT